MTSTKWLWFWLSHATPLFYLLFIQHLTACHCAMCHAVKKPPAYGSFVRNAVNMAFWWPASTLPVPCVLLAVK